MDGQYENTAVCAAKFILNHKEVIRYNAVGTTHLIENLLVAVK